MIWTQPHRRRLLAHALKGTHGRYKTCTIAKEMSCLPVNNGGFEKPHKDEPAHDKIMHPFRRQIVRSLDPVSYAYKDSESL